MNSLKNSRMNKTSTFCIHKKLRLLAFLLMLVCVVAHLCSCSAEKRVLRNPAKFERIAKEVIRRGYCVNDTSVVTVETDSQFLRELALSDSIYIGKEFWFKDSDSMTITDCFNTSYSYHLPSGVNILWEDGQLKVSGRIQYRDSIRVKVINNYIRDQALESVLRQDLTIARDSLKNLRVDLRSAKVTIRSRTLLIIGILSVIGVAIIVKVWAKLARLSIPIPLPF